MSEKIKIYMEDWLKTSGIVGLYNILNGAGDEVTVGSNYIEFDSGLLNGIEEKYFNYFIEKYKDILSIFKIISFKEFINSHENNDFKEFDEDSLKYLETYIKNTKKQLKSNSYKSAYELIDNNTDILKIEKSLAGIKIKKGEKIEDLLLEIKNRFTLIKEVINYMEQYESRKYIGGKNVMYTVIKNGWEGVSLLNPQTKERDMYLDYKAYFVDPVIKELHTDKSKYKYHCFSCDSIMKDLKNDLSFIKSMGFDVSRKSSHIWEFQNDVAICPLCKLVYSCVPAGINYIYDKGVFINDNSNMSNVININEKVYMEIYINNKDEKKLTYKALVESIYKEYNDKVKYELSDIQLVRFEEERYKFNILSKNMLKIIRDSEKDLNFLTKAGFKEINTYFNIYEMVVDRILNSQNMFTLIQKLLHYLISKSKDVYYSGGHILKILNINMRFLKEIGAMEKTDKDIVKLGNSAGYYLRKEYKDKNAVDKLGGISYKLLNALKTNNRNSFMDTLLNCYLYVKSQVPSIFLDVLRTDEEFKTIGYAFVTGLIEGAGKKNGGKKDE